MSDTPKKIFVNGKEVPPAKKQKLPAEVDWTALVKAKQ